MIKINLLKENEVPKSTYGLPKSFAVIPLAFVFIAATIYIVIVMGNRPKEQPVAVVEKRAALTEPSGTDSISGPSAQSSSFAKQPVKEAAGPVPVDKVAQPATEPLQPAAEIKSSDAVPADTSKSNYAPSTHASKEVIEDVVSDRGKKSGTELMALSYREMSQGEKINYEIIFTRKMFELLTRTVPEGIEFSSLAIDSFSVIKATGLGSSRELVGNLFRSLRSDKNLVLRERPISSIRPLGVKGYRFDFSCEASFGADTSEAYLATSNLKPHENFSEIMRTFSKLVSSDGIVLENGLERIASEKTAKCRRYTYHMSGSSTYLGFVKLVLDLQNKRLPCSFNRIQLKARNSMKINIDADVVFTLLD